MLYTYMYCEIHSCALAFAMSSQLNVNLNIKAASDWNRPLVAGRIKTLAAILFWTKTSVLFIIRVQALLLCHRIHTHEKEAFLPRPADLSVYARSGLLFTADPCILWWYKTQRGTLLLAHQMWHP